MSSSQHKIQALIVEDNVADADYIMEICSGEEQCPIAFSHSLTVTDAMFALGKNLADVLLLDLGLPDSTGLEGFERIHTNYPDLPILILTRQNDEELAVTAVKKGAQDYLVKGQINAQLLIRSILYGIERQTLMTKLKNSIDEIKTLRGLLPICSWCKKIRDDKGYWNQLEAYFLQHTEFQFSHGICPECAKKALEE